MKNKQNLKKGLVLVSIILMLYLIFHNKGSSTPTLPAPEVLVEKPKLMPVIEYITQTGNTVAFNSVNLVARIEGYLDEILFADGAIVKKDTPLFIIEPEPYNEKVKEAKASVAAQKAAHDYAKSEHARQQRMYKENATSLNNVEKWLAKTYESQAEVDKAIANEEIASINYSYTHINAPFDGRVGRHLVDVGNLVGNGKATNLATIEQIDPIYVYFNLNELDLIKVRKAAHDQGIKPSDINQIPVYVAMQNEKDFPHEGHLDFINTGLNASTGTIEFRALLENKNYPLLPGSFVKVRIAISKPSPQLTLPDTAIQYDQIGAYVFALDKDNKVMMKRVTLGSVEKGRRAILKGLQAEDRIIVDGLQFVTPGIEVTPKEENKKT